MTQSISYLMSGAAHLPYLVVSLNSLRQHYDGEVNVYAYPESIDLVTRICLNVGCTPKRWNPVFQGKNSQFLNKILMMQQIKADIGLYLDADTIINRSLNGLFDRAFQYQFLATQFCDWTTSGSVIKNRINRLVSREGVDQIAVQRVLYHHAPSVNGGVFACKKGSHVLDTWYEWSLAVRDIFIPDETCLHALIGWYEGSSNIFGIAEGGSFNCSPKHQPKNLSDEEIVIWHGHGDSFVRPQKSKKGFDLWWPKFQDCLSDNVGEITDWIDQIDNKFLNELLKTEVH